MANANDPNWLAYKRALGFEQSESERRTSVAVDEQRRQRDFQIPVFREEGKIGQRDIATARVNSGLYESSYTQNLLAEQERRINTQIAGLELDTTTSIAGIQSQAAVDVARMQREAAERALQLGIPVA